MGEGGSAISLRMLNMLPDSHVKELWSDFFTTYLINCKKNISNHNSHLLSIV